MKVAIAVRRFSPRGGLEYNSLELARRLVDRGHEVHVVCQRAEPGADVGATIHTVPVLGFLGEWPKILSFSRAACNALTVLKADVSFTAAHVVGADVVRLEGGLVADHRDAVGRLGPRDAWRLWSDPAERAAESIEIRKIACAKSILTLSDASREQVIMRYGAPADRVHVTRNGVDLERFRVPTDAGRAQARAALGVDASDSDGLVVAFIGTDYRRKGLGGLIRALAHSDAPRSTQLIIAGHDRTMPRFQALAGRLGVRAQFLGQRSDLTDVFAAADVLALPSLYEAFGLVALEALASGRPVVLSRACGASEVAPHPELIVDDPLDVPALARAIGHAGTLSAGPDIADDTARACRESAKAWPLQASLDAIERHLHEVGR